MISTTLWDRFIGAVDSRDLDDLRRDMIVEISVALSAIGWLLFLAAVRYEGRVEGLPVALALLAGSAASVWLRLRRLRLALYVLIVTPIVAITFFKAAFPESPAQYCFPIVVVVSSLLVSNVGVFAVASITSLACLAMAQWSGLGWLDTNQVVAPVVITYLTAAAAWLGSHQLHSALGWLENSYRRASALLEELRDERGAQARTLKALEDAYVRIEKMNYALVEARLVSDEAKRLKAEFAANVSHELRTPLNIVIGFSETLANAPETYRGVTWTPELRGDIEHIYRSARHLSSLIDDILDLSALEAQHVGLVVAETGVADVIEDAVAVVQDLFRAKNLYLRVMAERDLPRVQIDAGRIRQVLINLLTNASRFTTAGGVVVSAQLVDDEVQVAVADTGMGIAPQDVARVFEDFGQVDGSASRRHEGTGLGVPISKKLVQLHGGRMWLASRPGEGTTFYFTLPVAAQPRRDRRRPSSTPKAAAAGYRKAVLIFEPDPLLLRTVRRHLSGCDVVEIKSAGDLPTLIAQHQPVALLIDQQGADGVRAQDEWLAAVPGDLPTVTMALPGTLRSAQALGIQAYLIKPILREQLLDAIKWLERPVHTILVADDDHQVVDLICRMLQSAGGDFRALKAYGGEEALAHMRSEAVDLVLLDLVMPDLSGLAVLQQMKEDAALAEIPVIVVSAQDPELGKPKGGMLLTMARPDSPTLTETLGLLQALVGALPVRVRPSPAPERGSPEAPAGPAVS